MEITRNGDFCKRNISQDMLQFLSQTGEKNYIVTEGRYEMRKTAQISL